ncbi:glycosyltransferase family 2 protein [uncultured Subdoligranulum sp.]|uniref:glycosyltransferase family 2 protein n=1 Tax=uncultured Subdoligranulum sp. TaxID=512298 RepID=UPI0025D7F1A7|nr:glycosyltransferase family 2 protein [uncultured Subdoligranulum sp.]
MKISVVIPTYGCPSAVQPLCQRLTTTLTSITEDFEIILVNDACPKGSWNEIQKVCQKDTRIKGIELSRNFGQIRAITAGLDYCSGDWVVVMDCDLQDRPEGIADLFAKAQEGYDVVFARRKDRKDTPFVKFLSRTFYKVYDYFTDGQYDNTICNFSISKREVISSYCSMREQNRAYTLFLKWLGYRQTAIDIEADCRFEGKSSYNFRRKLSMAAQFVTAQSNKPLRMSVSFGFIIAALAIIYMLYRIIVFFAIGSVPEGWTSVITSLYLLGGIILVSNGILGIYIGYIFNEVKERPLYVVRSTLNCYPTDEKETKK